MSLLETKDLSVGYEKKIILSDINLTFSAGQIVGIIGPNGSGKSTILKTITKQIKALDGSISIVEKNIKNLRDSEIATRLSMVTTERIHPEKMSCKDVIATGRYPYTGTFGFLTEEDEKAVNDAIALVHAEEVCDKDFSKVSDGQRQRVMLARAICQNTQVIILDEPTSFLDMYYKLDLLKIIWKLAKEQNKLIVMSLHELDLVKSIADFLVCVDGNSVVKCGTVSEIFCNNFIQKLYGLKNEEFDENTGTMHLQLKNALGNGILPKAPAAACKAGERERSMELPARSEAEGSALKNKKHGAKIIMVQGTMSNAGKSFIVAGLCRIFKQDGYRVAPFKSQNMALNSFITKEGLEMGRAQVMQAEACGIEPEVCMNPILLKPTNDKGSQVIVNGEVIGNMEAREYFEYKKQLVPHIVSAFKKLEEKADIIVIEGAGSPAEINLRKNDIVNMGLAELLDAPVLLTGDIDRGGVFAQLLGTLELLSEEERARVKGLIINKFRGDKSILDSGIEMLEGKAGIKVTGVVPYMKVLLDDEDSLSSCFDSKEFGQINIGVIRLPRISNFTDFSVFAQINGVVVHYIKNAEEKLFEQMDMIIIPGSKNTIGDLQWLRESGIEALIKKFSESGKPVFGICGGYQMLGNSVSDPECVEEGGTIRGLELLNIKTVLEKEKVRTQVEGEISGFDGIFGALNGQQFEGYEIHMGKTEPDVDFNFENCVQIPGGFGFSEKNVFGSYIHGFFDNDEIAFKLCEALALKKGISLIENKAGLKSAKAFKESQYDLLADTLRNYIDMNEIYKILKPADIKIEY